MKNPSHSIPAAPPPKLLAELEPLAISYGLGSFEQAMAKGVSWPDHARRILALRGRTASRPGVGT